VLRQHQGELVPIVPAVPTLPNGTRAFEPRLSARHTGNAGRRSPFALPRSDLVDDRNGPIAIAARPDAVGVPRGFLL